MTTGERSLLNAGDIALISIFILVLIGFHIYSYLLFHTVVEIFTILIGFGAAVIAWNAYQLNENHYLTLIGLSFLFVSLLDLFHALAYQDMNIFRGFDANLPTQLWIATRYLQSISMLIASLLVKKKIKPTYYLPGYTLITLVALVSIFRGNFPDCYVAGIGLTKFKVSSEYLISAVFLCSGILFTLQRKFIDREVYQCMIASIILMIGGEIAFTLYDDVFGTSNFIGHLFIFMAYYMIYKATVLTGLTRPNAFLHRELSEKVQDLEKVSYALISAQEAVRKELSIDIHNQIGQLLSVLCFKLQSIHQKKDDLDFLDCTIADSSQILDEITDEIQDLMLKLRPPILDDLGLIPTLEWLIARLNCSTGINILLETDTEVLQRFNPNLEITVYRIIEEALNNALKYSEASTIQVNLSQKNGKIKFSIQDNGIGFPADVVDHELDKTGLISMRERVEFLRGEFQIETRPNWGTTIQIALPVL